ncbi:MAG: 4-(cytidine 5'-diphospho)-2-C-methyl-D-erythritol kinase [Clostridia bacterium]|nr:4-(cytidine 5'-diphospho)-2-C-methyl-D-erythritol kinase [Clostridia bacterium]
MNIRAYAKINATLDIIGLRDDGFHELRSVFLPISLFDSVTVEKSEKNVFVCDIPELRGDGNTCVKARDAFFRKTGITGGATVKLQKHIPYPAGLGGGSADAAAVIKGLNTLFGGPLTEEEMREVGAEVGSDVPFCLFGSPALCEGRGEKITPLIGVPKLYLTVAIGSGRLKTAEVYREYDKTSPGKTGFTDKFLASLDRGDEKGMFKSMQNAFGPVCAKLCPETSIMCARLKECKAEAALVSGSGPSVFGVFTGPEAADIAARELREKGFFAVRCETI